MLATALLAASYKFTKTRSAENCEVKGHGGAGAYPSQLGSRKGAGQSEATRRPRTNSHSWVWIIWIYQSAYHGRPEYPEKSYTSPGRIRKLHTGQSRTSHSATRLAERRLISKARTREPAPPAVCVGALAPPPSGPPASCSSG
ncbi:uncharacterized protein LOC144194478 [Stigmatopora nigra]